ncbi:LysR family transcriptional regulator [Herbaspirillum autotrophicum]|uniref:LysR family transcriptional regulator n=1 Tax=Herbaspirillum autotrophicum TaxID=180195 RepID=UPI00067D6AB1|nr:LysR family transcriptional regulator [Herbaspirillum autotrophicum]
MYAITDLQLFIHTADSGSLSQAARMLEILPATASASLKRLEQRLKVRLFARSTRSMRLTPEGEIFLEYCRDALALLQEGEALLSSGKEDIKGHLRLSMPSDTGRNVLLGWLDDFQEQHPEVSFTLQFSDRMADLYRDAVDVAIRSGKLVDSSLVSQQLASSRRVLVAAPDYLKKYGTPQTPDDLVHHNCLLFYLRHGLFNHWHFGSGKQVWDIKVSGNRMSDDATIARVWAVAGVGIAYKSWIDVRADVQSGRLVTLLDEFTCEEVPLHAVYPHRNSASPTVRALLAFLRAGFAALDAGEQRRTS